VISRTYLLDKPNNCRLIGAYGHDGILRIKNIALRNTFSGHAQLREVPIRTSLSTEPYSDMGLTTWPVEDFFRKFYSACLIKNLQVNDIGVIVKWTSGIRE